MVPLHSPRDCNSNGTIDGLSRTERQRRSCDYHLLSIEIVSRLWFQQRSQNITIQQTIGRGLLANFHQFALICGLFNRGDQARHFSSLGLKFGQEFMFIGIYWFVQTQRQNSLLSVSFVDRIDKGWKGHNSLVLECNFSECSWRCECDKRYGRVKIELQPNHLCWITIHGKFWLVVTQNHFFFTSNTESFDLQVHCHGQFLRL